MAAGMGDETKRFSPGDRWNPTSTVLNGWQDAADYVRDQERGNGALPKGMPAAQGIIVPVQNNSGSDRNRFDVLGIDTPIFTPTNNADAFYSRQGLNGVTPSLANDLGKFVVLLRPVPNGAMGPGLISGIVPCKVNVAATASNPLTGQSWYQYADIDDSATAHLILRPFGAAQVLWKASTSTGDQWALVRIGPPSGIVILSGTLSELSTRGVTSMPPWLITGRVTRNGSTTC